MASSTAGADSGASALQRLAKEQVLVEKKLVPGVKFVPGGETNPLEWTMHIDAPGEYIVNGATRPCPYASACFPVKMAFPVNYPFKHPEITFTPGQLYHPNVDASTGAICADTINKVFGPTKNVTDLARLVLQFMAQPNLESPLNADAAQEISSAATIAKYEEKARKAAEKAPRKA